MRQADYVTYTALINACAKRSDVTGATAWLREILAAWVAEGVMGWKHPASPPMGKTMHPCSVTLCRSLYVDRFVPPVHRELGARDYFFS